MALQAHDMHFEKFLEIEFSFGTPPQSRHRHPTAAPASGSWPRPRSTTGHDGEPPRLAAPRPAEPRPAEPRPAIDPAIAELADRRSLSPIAVAIHSMRDAAAARWADGTAIGTAGPLRRGAHASPGPSPAAARLHSARLHSARLHSATASQLIPPPCTHAHEAPPPRNDEVTALTAVERPRQGEGGGQLCKTELVKAHVLAGFPDSRQAR